MEHNLYFTTYRFTNILDMQLDYKDYYLRTIYKRENGIKLVLGGTGLGKTHGMREAVKEYLNSDEKEKRKLIYITNRHNLITEQKREFDNAKFKCSYLKSNREIILDILKSNQFNELIENLESNGLFKYDDIYKSVGNRKSKLTKLSDSIESKIQLLNDGKQKSNTLIRAIDKELGLDCDELYKFFKNQLSLVGRNEQKLHEKLKGNKFVWKLFPYVEFENNSETNILLVTIHKVLMGFFDGKKDIKIASIENKIIFLDEFDFLEQEIMKILCSEPSIINPLEFVRIFYEKFKHWSFAEFWESTEELKNIRDKFNGVITYIDDAMREKRLNFPNVIDFRLDNKSENSERPYMLFQTNEIITPKPFFLREKNNSWYIQEEKTADSVSPFQLFNILAIATSKILGVFHYCQRNQTLVSEIIQAIWNQKNDNFGGKYETYINENCLYHRTKTKSGKDYKAYKDKSPYEIGFRLVKLAKRSQSFDPNSAELGQVELFTSPEAVIAKLSDSNIVFALSATTDIPRTQKCFNIEWLKENATYIELEKDDFEIIKARRNIKANVRQTKVSLRIAELLKEEHPVGVILKSKFQNKDYERQNETELNAKPRYERLLRMFDTLYRGINSDKFSHLIFGTTFGDLKEIFDFKSNENHLLFIEMNRQIFDSTRFDKNNDRFYSVVLEGKQCSVLFLNSDDAKKLQESKEALENYRKCFAMRDKVFVITQYKSASNGVNLPCFANMGEFEEDFQGIHLLEPQHFWFDDSKEFSDYKNNEKQALWYLWKLKDSGQFDSGQFNLCLSARDPKASYKINISKINNLYKDKADEKILNSIALYHQAIGRIERKNERVPEVDVTLEMDVFKDFYQFVSSENSKELAEQRKDITSALILEVHEAVIREAKKREIKFELYAQKSIDVKQAHSRQIIEGEILQELAKVRDGRYDTTISQEIKEAWAEIRDALLKHDFEKRVNIETIGKTIYIKRDFTFETKYINMNKELFIDVEKMKVYREIVPHKDLTTWNLDLAYRCVNGNNLLKQLFENNGYKTSFEIRPNVVNYILTPYIYQAILSGAIGELAISLLLNYHGINLESIESLDNSLFEVIDAKIKGIPIYFDFKNYAGFTLDKFSFKPIDRCFDEELNSNEFIKKLKTKYEILSRENPNAILYIINLYSEQKRKPDFFDMNMKSVQYEKDSCIRIIPSVLSNTDINQISLDFQSSLKLISVHETANM